MNEKTRQGNRLTAKLKLYFPQILNWFDEVDSALVGALLERWPTLEALQKARPATLRSFFTQHNCRREELIEQRLEQIRQAIPAIRDAAVIQSAVAMVSVLVAMIATLREGIAALDRQIEQAVAAHPDFAIFDSFPELVRYWRLACLLPLARTGPLSIGRRAYSSSAGLLPSWCAAERPPGFTTAGLVPSSFVRRSRNGPDIPSASVTGLGLTINSNASAGRPPRCGTGARLQVDSDRVSMLERSRPLR